MSEHSGNTDTPVAAEVEALPIEAKVVSGDERISAWYYKLSEGYRRNMMLPSIE
jgi:hypothetical protein